ncbi:MAG: phage tail protein, partial [Mesorhizobium sp.]
MVKTPKMRHSKSRREPVTIELEPGAVSRVADEQDASTQQPAEAQTDEARAEEGANASQPEPPEEPVHAD